MDNVVIQKACVACGNPFDREIESLQGILCPSCEQQGLFRKKLIITGITRMNNGHVCVSGVDPKTWRFIRPVFPSGLNRDFVMEGNSQVIRHFNLVEVEFKEYRPDTEFHTEDWVINDKFAPRFVRQLTNREVLAVLNKMAINDLQQAVDRGDRSLFIVRAQSIGNIWHEQYEKFKVRVTFVDAAGNLFRRIVVTDLLTLAFTRHQIAIGNNSYSDQLVSRFNQSRNRFIRIGLTRPWRNERWKQVTALITVPDLFDGLSFVDFERKAGKTS